MAVEEWLLSLVERGEDISRWATFILENATSVAFVSLLVGVVLAEPNALRDGVLPLLGTLAFYRRDLERYMLDEQQQRDLRSFLGIPTGSVDDVYYDERKRSDARQHRKSHLEQLAFRLQFGPLRPQITELIDAMKRDIGKEDQATESSITARMILKRIDLREYEIAGKTQEGIFLQPKLDEPELRAVSEATQQKHEGLTRLLRLHSWAAATFSREGTGSEAFADWRGALREAHEISALTSQRADGENGDDGVYDHRRLRVFAYVAACLVRDQRSDLDPEQIAWCIREILQAVGEDADTLDETTQVGRFAVHGSRPAAAVLPLLLDVCRDKEAVNAVRAAIAQALTHSVDEVRWWAINGAREWLWQQDPVLAERCFNGLLEFASLRRKALEEYRRSPTRTGSFKERTRVLAQNLRRHLTAGEKQTQPGPSTVRLADFIEQDLLAALRLVPTTQTEARYRKAFANVMTQLVQAEATRDEARRRSPRELSIQFRTGFSTAFAEFLLKQEVGGEGAELLDALVASVERAPEAATDVLQQLVYAEDRSPCGEPFWTIWKRCAETAFENATVRRAVRIVGYHERRKLLRTLLFAETPWKEGLKQWEPLKRHRNFVAQAFSRVGDTPAGFAALVRLLRTVGHFLLPDALKDVDEARSRCTATPVLEDEGARFDLELLMRDCVLAMGAQVRSRELLRKATLNLLDFLVNQGSSLAFQLREFIVAPVRSTPSAPS